VHLPEKEPEQRLRDLTPTQWKSGLAAWLGWFFDGLELHLYTLVATPFVMKLVQASVSTDPEVKEKGSYIQAAFLFGWALGGGFFGRIGDLLGRSRALCFTILTYAIFTGLSATAVTWWQLMIFRFIAALGVGGEWAIGAALLSETWPKHMRPWIAAVLQTGVNVGILLACGVALVMKGLPERYVFLVGIVPALIVYWIRRHVPEPEEWRQAKNHVAQREPGISELFRGQVLKTTILSIIVCALGLSGWWAFMYWQQHHIMNLRELSNWDMTAKRGLVATTFFTVIFVSIFGNFAAGGLAKLVGYRRAIAIMCAGFVASFIGAFAWEWNYLWLTRFWLPLIGFWSGLFGLFTMFLPPLFPTLLRTTGAGFCYNIGRIFSAVAVIVFGAQTSGGDFRKTLLAIGMLFLPMMFAVMCLSEPPDERADGANMKQQPR